ncbi:hypothetical protein P3X46_013645 [Hevea brasiliensis]|uniref:Agamous-like MADS-box protein AGL62 n=1 Tax=Hevea brasiliensis TaxID=3981 RepID=A0ABQ9M4C5_HEVBR|nr:hypothetical protein P3X46_013645 [Hevea brasiliensis]
MMHQVSNQLEMEKKKTEELNHTRKENKSQCWWEAPIEELNLPQLEQLKVSLEHLKKNVARQVDKLLIQNSQVRHQQFYASTSGAAVLPFESKNVVFNPDKVPSHGYGRGFY